MRGSRRGNLRSQLRYCEGLPAEQPARLFATRSAEPAAEPDAPAGAADPVASDATNGDAAAHGCDAERPAVQPATRVAKIFLWKMQRPAVQPAAHPKTAEVPAMRAKPCDFVQTNNAQPATHFFFLTLSS